MTEPVSALPLRTCGVCGLTDDHPRCLVDDGTGADLTYHPGCHRVGFGDSYVDGNGAVQPFTCHDVLDAGGDVLTGDDLRARIVEFNQTGA